MRTSKSLVSISREMEEALLAACDDNDLISVNAWIGMGANMNMICESGRTPLCAAAQAGNVRILQMMVENATRQGIPAASSDEAHEYSTDSELTDDDEMWFSEGVSSSGDPGGPGGSNYHSATGSCDCPGALPGEICARCVGIASQLDSDEDLDSIYSANHVRRNKRMRRMSPNFEDISDRNEAQEDESGSGESDCFLEVYRRHVREYFNNADESRSPHSSSSSNDTDSYSEDSAPSAAPSAAASAAALSELDAEFDADSDAQLDAAVDAQLAARLAAEIDAEVDADSDAQLDAAVDAQLAARLAAEIDAEVDADSDAQLDAAIDAAIDAHLAARLDIDFQARIDADSDAQLAARLDADFDARIDADFEARIDADFEARVDAEIDPAAEPSPPQDGAAEPNPPQDGAAERNEEVADDDDPEGGYVEVVERVRNEFDNLAQRYPRGYIFGIFDNDEMDGLEVVSSSSDDSLVHYTFRIGRHGLMSRNPLYHSSPWRSGIFSKTNCLSHRVPNPRSLNKKDHFGSRPIHYAIVGGHVEVLRILVNAGCKLNVGDEEKLFPLHMAAARDIPEEIELLIAAGARVNVKTVDKVTPLHVAASRGLLENVRLLVENGARVNAFDKFNRSPLYMAVLTHHKDVVAYLLTKEAKVNVEEIHGYTPLFEALTQKNVGMLRILAAGGANVNQSPCLLHQAVTSKNETMVREILEAGCMVNGREENGDTALMVAARTLQPTMVKILLEHGAVVDLKNPCSGEGALLQMMASITENPPRFNEIFPLFLEHGLDLDYEMAYKCLQHSIINGEDEIGALLIKRGAVKFLNIPEIYSQLATDLFYEVLIRESWVLVKLFVLAGFDSKRLRLVTRSPNSVEQWVVLKKTSPLKLSDLCRIVVRSKLDNKVFERVSFLNLPSSIQSFIKLEDVN